MINMMVLFIDYKQEINNEIFLINNNIFLFGNEGIASIMIFNTKDIINISHNDNVLEIKSKNKNNEIMVTKFKYEKDYDINKSIIKNKKEVYIKDIGDTLLISEQKNINPEEISIIADMKILYNALSKLPWWFYCYFLAGLIIPHYIRYLSKIYIKKGV